MTARRSAVGAVLVLLLGACGDAGEVPDLGAPVGNGDEAVATEPGTQDTAAMAPPGHEPAEVALLDAGDEPRTALRLSAQAGDVAQLRVTSEREVSGEAPGSVTGGLPPFTLELEVLEVDGERLEVSLTIIEVATDDQQLAAPLMEVEGLLEMDDRGRVHEVSAAVETGDADAAPEAFDAAWLVLPELFDVLRLLPAFPQEPVGAGAVWTVEQPSLLPGPVWEVATVTIDQFDGQRYRLRTEATYEPWQEWLDWQQQAAQDSEDIPPPALREFEGSGTGELWGSLGGLVPDHASRSREMTAVAELPEGGTVQSTMQVADRLERS